MHDPGGNLLILKRWARICLALLAFTAIAVQLSIHVRMGFSLVNFFSYFTNLSNIVAACVLAWSAFKVAGLDALRALSAVNMTAVGLIFAVLLRDTDLGSLLPWVNVTLHYVMPCAVILDWLAFPPGVILGARHLAMCLAFPSLYLGYLVLRGRAIGWYPYPFLNPADAGGAAGVAVYAAAIAVTFLLAGWALLSLGNKIGSRSSFANG